MNLATASRAGGAGDQGGASATGRLHLSAELGRTRQKKKAGGGWNPSF